MTQGAGQWRGDERGRKDDGGDGAESLAPGPDTAGGGDQGRGLFWLVSGLYSVYNPVMVEDRPFSIS